VIQSGIQSPKGVQVFSFPLVPKLCDVHLHDLHESHEAIERQPIRAASFDLLLQRFNLGVELSVCVGIVRLAHFAA
jgi:hypothetical protein